jgi:putative transposase
MRQSRFSVSQITAILKERHPGTTVPEICRRHGISVQTFYQWRSKYGGGDASYALEGPMRELEEENRRLRGHITELRIENIALRNRIFSAGKSELSD